jgi:hypothetical protein
MAKTGRNEPCPCGKTGPDGNRLKYKRCCGSVAPIPAPAPKLPPDDWITQQMARHRASELIRQQQQGLGRPIIGGQLEHHQIVAVKNKVHWGKWKTFPDFLQDYIKTTLDPLWGNSELAKPFGERHPIIQWYEAYCAFQRKNSIGTGKVQSGQITGVVACYLMLAYNLYLIGHNVDLQARMVARLKDKANFQGAYYELMVASILLRAGFELTLEDETSRDTKHCEFAAVSKKTGKKYWIEAKMKGVSGLMGKTDADGSNDTDPLSHLVKHLAGALRKPAADDRMIFVDVNAELAADLGPDNPPAFMQAAERRMERYVQTQMPAGATAYVFVTCTSFHRDLEGLARMIAFPYGLGIPDFNFRGPMRLSERYRQKQRHPDALAVGEALTRYLVIPTTFDGELPSEQFHGGSRVLIGSTYQFGEGEDAVIGTVTTATVSETEKLMIVGITTNDGKHVIGRLPMTDEELHDYRSHRDAYFGVVQRAPSKLKTPSDLFDWLMDVSKNMSRDKILEWFGPSRDKAALSALSDEDLLIEYCEAATSVMVAREEQAKKAKAAT